MRGSPWKREAPTRTRHRRVVASCTTLLLCLIGAAAVAGSTPSVVVFGIDGMDPKILDQYIDAGLMPNFERLASSGDYRPLGTSVPPQSPVAWSNFITGLDSGGHGIFDFIHRDPATMLPYLSTARIEGEEGSSFRLGRYVIPLSQPKTVNLRDGLAFWEILEQHGVPATVFKIPANYPPTDFKGRSLSGMGTPDLLGTAGTFSYFTDDQSWFGKTLDAGAVYPVEVRDQRVEAALHGPANPYVRVDEKHGETPPDARVPFTVWVDGEHQTARIDVQGQQIVLEEGDWSRWVEVEFELLPHLVKASAICRFYLMEAEPSFRLYVTPLNLSPRAPAQPLSTPSSYAKEIYEDVGYFYTQGMPEDTKALTGAVFDDSDFVTQAGLVLEERHRLFEYTLDHWDGAGFLFFYVSSVDQQCHMLWRHIDAQHPAHDPRRVHEFGQVLTNTYIEMDRWLGELLDRLDQSTTLIVMSDHGFAPFRRAVNLNTWLVQEGYLVLKDPLPAVDDVPNLFAHVDWQRTRAYAMGLNLLYINVQGRERFGSVPRRDRRGLADEIASRLLDLRDPQNGARMVTRMYPREEIYHGPHVTSAPDLVVGYASGYRGSWQTVLGGIPAELVVDNDAKWSGDHCMDHTAVPGIVLANRPITHPDPALTDLTVTILNEFGIESPEAMRGRSIFATTSAHAAD